MVVFVGGYGNRQKIISQVPTRQKRDPLFSGVGLERIPIGTCVLHLLV